MQISLKFWWVWVEIILARHLKLSWEAVHVIYYLTCECEVGNPSWIDSDLLEQSRVHCSMSWSRGWVGQVKLVNRNMFHSSLLLISRWWSIHGTEPHILSGICFNHGSTATQRLDNDVDLNKIKEIIQQGFKIEMERSTLYLITFYKMILVIFPSIKSCIPVTEWVQVTFKQSATFSQIAW